MEKILIVEDYEPFRMELFSFLSFEGFEVICAKDGVEGIQMALQHKPNIIISDIKMPRLNGYDLLRTLKQIKTTQNTPFIFISVYNQAEDIRKSLLLEADDYLIKPINLNRLTQSIHMVLNKQKRNKRKTIQE